MKLSRLPPDLRSRLASATCKSYGRVLSYKHRWSTFNRRGTFARKVVVVVLHFHRVPMLNTVVGLHLQDYVWYVTLCSDSFHTDDFSRLASYINTYKAVLALRSGSFKTTTQPWTERFEEPTI